MTHDRDPFHLERFVGAQAPVYEQACAELAAGNKTSHWMWFVFPQLAQLGRSATARHYGIADDAQALVYLRHSVLGSRLMHCTSLVLAVEGRTAHQIFHSPDDLKFRSCMTLFDAVAPQEAVFGEALHKYFGGERDPLTLALLPKT